MTLHQISGSLGLLFDIAGAIFVVRGVVFLQDDEIAAASDRTAVAAGGARYHPRPALQRLFRDSRRDAQVGGVLLVIGFIGQLVAVWV